MNKLLLPLGGMLPIRKWKKRRKKTFDNLDLHWSNKFSWA